MYTYALVVCAVLFPGPNVKGGGRKSNLDVEHTFSETEKNTLFLYHGMLVFQIPAHVEIN